jgi:hypothetical protein
MRTIRIAVTAVAMLATVAATAHAQAAGRGGRGGGGGGGGGGVVSGGQAGGGGTFSSVVVISANRPLAALFLGTSAARDTAAMTTAATIHAKYAADIQLGRVTRAGPPADSLVAKARVATTKRNEELRTILKSDGDRKKFDENVAASLAPRGGGPGE